MYVINDICYAGKPGGEIRAVDAKPLKGGMLLVTFSSGEKKLFDTTQLDGSAFLPLQDENVFCTAKVEHGFVSWKQGEIDISPEYLYDHGIVYEETDDCLEAS